MMAAPQTHGAHAAPVSSDRRGSANSATKAEATLIAQLALAGHVVTRGQCGDYNCSKWGYIFYAQDLETLRQFAIKLRVLR